MTVTLHPDIEEVVERVKYTRALTKGVFLPMLHIKYETPPDLLVALPHGVTEIIEHMAPRFGAQSDRGIKWVAFMADSCRLKDPSQIEADAPAGTLRARFEAGDPLIDEGIVINIIGRVGNLFAFVPYTHGPDGMVWGEMALHPNTDSRVVNALTKMVEASWINREEHA